MNEATVWKLVAWLLGLILAGSVLLNSFSSFEVSGNITSFILGCLIAIAVGYSVVTPRSSPVMLSDQEENRFRKQQYVVGIVFSVVLSLVLIVSDEPDKRLIWLFMPIILLSPFLVAREYVLQTRKGG